jgi:uncharacterized heparinase superfamily protein
VSQPHQAAGRVHLRLSIADLRPSVYFDPDHRNPRATKQVVLFSTLADYGGAIGWCFLRAQ